MKNEANNPINQDKSSVNDLNDFFSVKNDSKYNKTKKRILLAERISRFLLENDISKGQFAEKMSVQPSVISKWLSGTHNFTIETLFDIEEIFPIKLINVGGEQHAPNKLNFNVTSGKVLNFIPTSTIPFNNPVEMPLNNTTLAI